MRQTTTADAPLAAVPSGRGLVSRIIADFRARRLHVRTVAMLGSLSDHSLDDIGLSRATIARYADLRR